MPCSARYPPRTSALPARRRGAHVRHNDESPDAWVMIDAVVTEHLEFSFNEGVDVTSPRSSALAVVGKRILSISTPEPEPTVADEVTELF